MGGNLAKVAADMFLSACYAALVGLAADSTMFVSAAVLRCTCLVARICADLAYYFLDTAQEVVTSDLGSYSV